MKEERAKPFQGRTLQSRLFGLGLLLIIPSIIMTIYLLYSLNRISNSYNTIVQNITLVNEYNLVFKEDMDAVMYMMVAHSLSKNEVEENLGMTNPDSMIRDASEAFENVQTTTVSPEALERVKGALKLLHTLHKRVDDISLTVKETGTYDDNMERLDTNIRVITEMIQERISEYIYHESVSMEAIRREINQKQDLLTRSSILVLLLMIGASVFLSVRITRSITVPIHNLIGAISQIGHGNFQARAQISGSPEIKTLSTGFNSMAARLDDLVERNRQEQIRLRNLELQLLQAQINPHFLYNTLDNIVWLAEDGRKEDVAGIAMALSSFFRASLSGGRDIIRIREEVLHIRSYLEIQQFRYRDMLTYSIEVEPACEDLQIPKMTIQPIVENALYHGIKNKRGGGHISIRIEREDSRMAIRVKDTGIGMTEEQVKALVRQVDGSEHRTDRTGIGLVNVAERLRLNYGESAGIVFHSVYGEGTEVEILIPGLLYEEELPSVQFG